MKNIILSTIFIILSALSMKAQISLSSDNCKVEVPRIYIGALNANIFSVDSLSVNPFISVRVGGQAFWHISDKFHIESYLVNETAGKDNKLITSFGLKFDISNNSYIRIGKIATPTTFTFRPHPVSADAQFETWTHGSLPGGGIGVQLNFYKTNIGVYNKNDAAEFHISQEVGKFSASGWYSENTHGIAASYSGDKISTTMFYKNNVEEILGNFFSYGIKEVVLYSDFGYSISSNDIVRLEIGLLKPFEVKFMKGLIGFGGDYKTRSINGYLQLNI